MVVNGKGMSRVLVQGWSRPGFESAAGTPKAIGVQSQGLMVSNSWYLGHLKG